MPAGACVLWQRPQGTFVLGHVGWLQAETIPVRLANVRDISSGTRGVHGAAAKLPVTGVGGGEGGTIKATIL